MKLFFSYLKTLMSKWVLWLFLILDCIGLFIASLTPSLSIPVQIFWAVAFGGLIWSGFQVHQENIKALSSFESVLVPNTKPNLEIELVEGNEYSFNLSGNASLLRYTPTNLAEREEGEKLQNANLTMHLILTNRGSTKIDILSLNIHYKDLEIPWDFMNNKSYR